MNVHRVRLARRGAAACRVGHNHHIRVGAVSAARQRVALARVHFRVVDSPFVFVGRARDAVVQVRNEGHVVCSLAHIMVAADRNRRHRSNNNCVKAHFRNTATTGLGSRHTINISGVLICNGFRNISVVCISNSFNLNTILIPSISKRFIRSNS